MMPTLLFVNSTGLRAAPAASVYGAGERGS